MKVRYTPAALSDREQILEYLKERSAGGARNVTVSIRETIEQLRKHPHSGYRTDDPNVRVIFCHPLSLQNFLSRAGRHRDPAHTAHIAKNVQER